MLHAGYQWNGAAVPPTAHWDKPLVGVELYDHRAEAAFPTDFDSPAEQVNVANRSEFAATVQELSAALRAQFG